MTFVQKTSQAATAMVALTINQLRAATLMAASALLVPAAANAQTNFSHSHVYFGGGSEIEVAMDQRTMGHSVAAARGPNIVVADVGTGYEYRPYCTSPNWQGPWLSYRWNAQEYVETMTRRGYKGCSIRVRHSSEKWN